VVLRKGKKETDFLEGTTNDELMMQVTLNLVILTTVFSDIALQFISSPK